MYYSSSRNAPPQDSSVEDRMIAGIRIVLASAAFLSIWFSRCEPDRRVQFTYLVLALYIIYSAIVCLLEWRAEFPTRIRVWSHWGDVACYTLLIALSSGTKNAVFSGTNNV